MRKYINDIIDRNYNDSSVKSILKLVLPYLIDYYGKQNISLIVDALRTTTFLVCPSNASLEKFINNTLNIQIDNYFNTYLNSSLINSSNGISYTESSRVIYDKNTDSFINKGVDRKIIFIRELKDLNFENISSKEETIIRVVIHELIKKMKSIKNASNIRGNKKISRCGLHTIYNRIDKNGKDVRLSFLSETGKGLSDGLCEYDTLYIFNQIFGHEFKDITNPLEVYVVRKLFANESLETLIHETELNGDIIYLRSLFDRLNYNGAYDKLIKLGDKLSYENYKANEKTYNILSEEIINYLDSLKVLKGNEKYERKVA